MSDADKFLQNFLKRWSRRKRAEHAPRAAVPEPPRAATERAAARENDNANANAAVHPRPAVCELCCLAHNGKLCVAIQASWNEAPAEVKQSYGEEYFR